LFVFTRWLTRPAARRIEIVGSVMDGLGLLIDFIVKHLRELIASFASFESSCSIKLFSGTHWEAIGAGNVKRQVPASWTRHQRTRNRPRIVLPHTHSASSKLLSYYISTMSAVFYRFSGRIACVRASRRPLRFGTCRSNVVENCGSAALTVCLTGLRHPASKTHFI
jgi:hypothetical protein